MKFRGVAVRCKLFPGADIKSTEIEVEWELDSSSRYRVRILNGKVQPALSEFMDVNTLERRMEAIRVSHKLYVKFLKALEEFEMHVRELVGEDVRELLRRLDKVK